VSSKKQDASVDSKTDVTELQNGSGEIVKGFCTEVNGRNLDSYSNEIRTSWKIGTDARLNVGKLLCVVMDNEMLKHVKLTFDSYVSQFGIKSSMGYLLMKIYRDSEVRGLVEKGLPLQAADSIIGIGNKYGEKYRDQLVDYANGKAPEGPKVPTYNCRELRNEAKQIRKRAKSDANPPAPT